MPVIPTVTIIASPVSITTSNPQGLSYQQLIATLNWIVYKVSDIYISANTIQQASQLYTIFKTTPTGQTTQDNLITLINPLQKQAIVNFELSPSKLEIDLLTTLRFNLLPNETVQLDFWADTISFNYLLGQKGYKEILPEKETEKNNPSSPEMLQAAAAILMLIGATLLIYASTAGE